MEQSVYLAKMERFEKGEKKEQRKKFDFLNGVTSAIQTQLDYKSTKGFAIAMAVAM